MPINTSFTLIPTQFPRPFREETVTTEVATALRESAERIRGLGQLQTQTVLAIGKELSAVERLLPADQFGPWIRKEFGMTDETAGAYTAAMRNIAADPNSGKNSPRAKLVAWAPDRERQKGPSGYADIELPWGFKVVYCPVFSGGPAGTFVEWSSPGIIEWPRDFTDALYADEFNDDIIAQIREVDPGAFEKDRGSLRIDPVAPGAMNKGIGGENLPGGASR